MKIKFFGNDRLFQKLKKRWLQITEDVGQSGQYLNGPYTAELEKVLAHRCQRKFAILCNSGTDALICAHEYFQLPNVLVTNFSFLASASTVSRVNGQPQFVDIDPIHLSPSPNDYQKQLNSHTRGLVHVEIAGSSHHHADVEAFSHQKKIIMIEDAAQSFGSYCQSRPSGSFGHASALSFDPTKTLPGSSPAGCLLTDDQNLYHFAMQRRLHGRASNGEFLFAGVKSLISETEAALLLMKLDHLDEWVTRKNQIAHFYSSALKSLPLVVPSTQLPYEAVLIRPSHVFHKYILRVEPDDQAPLQKYLQDAGIETRIYYPKCLSDEALYQHLSADTPQAKKLTMQALALPIYPELLDEECQYVVEQIQKFYEQNQR